MKDQLVVVLALVPATIVVSFFVHWLSIAGLRTAEERLPYCRGAYLAMSLQLVLYAWVTAVLLGTSGLAMVLLPLGMTLSFAGDVFNLQFPSISKRVGEPLFFGIICFAVAQTFYIGAFLAAIPFGTLVSEGFFIPVLAVLVIVPAIMFRFKVYDQSRPRTVMMAALVYGFFLGTMAAVAVSAAIAMGGSWYFVAAGALFFLLSDAIMGDTTIRGRHPRNEYQLPWITYLAAQGLLLFGMAFV